VTVAYLPSNANRPRRDQSISPRLPDFIDRAHQSLAPADAATRPPRPTIMAASPPGFGFDAADIGGDMHGYAQVTSCG